MFLKKELKNLNKINYNTKIIYPIFKKNNQVQIYWYRFLKSRTELLTIKGKIIKKKKKEKEFRNKYFNNPI